MKEIKMSILKTILDEEEMKEIFKTIKQRGRGLIPDPDWKMFLEMIDKIIAENK